MVVRVTHAKVSGKTQGSDPTKVYGNHWDADHTIIGDIGDVVGPASVTDDVPAVFDGTTGKLIKEKTYAAFKTLLALVKGDVGLGNVDNTSDATKNSASATLTNKTFALGSNTFSGTLAQFNTALTDTSNFATIAEFETFQNKTISGIDNTLNVRLHADVSGNLPVANLNTGVAASSSTFWRGDGAWASPTGSNPILTGTVSNQATIDVDFSTVVANYRKIIVYLYDIVVATDGACVDMMVSSNAGVSWDNSAGQYDWAFLEVFGDTTILYGASRASHANLDFQYRCSTQFGNAAGEGGAIEMTFHNPKGTSIYKYIEHTAAHAFTDGVILAYKGGGIRKTTSAINAARFRAANNNNTGATNGNISCSWAVYGE